MRILLVFLVLCINNVFAQDEIEYEIGYLRGHHFISKNMNDNHVIASIGTKRYKLHYFYNSYKKHSFAAARRIHISNNFKVDIGLVSGYEKKNVPSGLWFTNNLMLMAAPTFEVSIVPNVKFKTVVLGDSINLGFTWGF